MRLPQQDGQNPCPLHENARFDYGVKQEETPLIAVVGASNQLPEGEELDALFDRFLLRLQVGPVLKAAFPALLGLPAGNGLGGEVRVVEIKC